jgi:deoxyribonuclease-4
MAARLLGAHMPTAGGLDKAVRAGKEIGCSAVQVFTSSPQQWKAKAVTDDAVKAFTAAKEATGIQVVVSHDSYLVNLCAPDPEKREMSIRGLIGEIGRCAQYGIGWVVSHVGATMGQDREVARQMAADGIRRVLAESPDTVMLCMETTAGQGSSLNSSFEELAWFLEALKGNGRLCVCLDTCHVYVAGYDLREGYEHVFQEFERVIGLNHLQVIHCNDSKKPLGSRVDRHEHLGEGEIGSDAFRHLVNDPRFETIPILLETPEAPEGHARNLAKLLEWRNS